MVPTKPIKRKVNYSLRADLVKRVKREAVESDCWPSEVIEAALEEFLANKTGKGRRAEAAASA